MASASSSSFLLVGHRGVGQNRPPAEAEASLPQATAGEVATGAGAAPQYSAAVRENTIKSLNKAAGLGADFVEFDVQVTSDGHPVLFHDNVVITMSESGEVEQRSIPQMTLQEFQLVSSHCIPQDRLLRRRKDGSLYVWRAAEEDEMPTLAQVFEQSHGSLGFNIELKFAVDDPRDVTDADVAHMLDHVIQVVSALKGNRSLFFSSFIPQAVVELKRRQPQWEVLFLTEGKQCVSSDESMSMTMNGVAAAVDLCTAHSLNGVVSEVSALLPPSSPISVVKAAHLRLLSYGALNDDVGMVMLQLREQLDGVIVDDVATVATALARRS